MTIHKAAGACAAALSLALTLPAFATGPEITAERFPDYDPAHTVIKCPYLPEGMKDIPLCGGQRATCVGTAGSDLILGTDENDVIVAGRGNDVVHGDAEDDTVCGGPGNVYFYVDPAIAPNISPVPDPS